MHKIIDENDYNEIFSILNPADREKYLIVHYRLKCKELSHKESAALLAINTSLGTVKKLSYEEYNDRAKYSAKVISASEGEFIQIAFPLDICEPKTGLASLLSLLWYSSEYNYTAGFRIEHIEFPASYLSFFQGPKLGINGIRERFGIKLKPILGTMIKPRRGIDLNTICQKCYDAYIGGVDYISDDELVIDPDTDLAFEKRVKKIVEIALKASDDTGQKKWFVANITSSPMRAFSYAKKAKELGADALLVNAFTMGFSVLEDLAKNPEVDLPIITCNMGTAVVTRPTQLTGMSEVVISELSRIAGADAVNSGIVGSVWYNSEAEPQSLSNLRKPFGNLKASFPVVAGGLTIANLLPNLHDHGSDVILQAGGGIMGFPSGPKYGASAFRKIVDNFHIGMSRYESEKMLIDLGKKDKKIQTALTQYGFSPQYCIKK